MPLTKNTNTVSDFQTNSIRDSDIELMKPPLEYYYSGNPIYWILGIVIAGLIAFILYKKYFKKEKPIIVPLLPPHIRARTRIEQAKRFLGDPRQFCFEISAALRIYIEERFSLRAPERTTEEFLLDLQNTALLSREQKELLADFLTRCDLVKFARFEPAEEDLLALQESALKFVDETAPYGESEKVVTQDRTVQTAV